MLEVISDMNHLEHLTLNFNFLKIEGIRLRSKSLKTAHIGVWDQDLTLFLWIVHRWNISYVKIVQEYLE